MKIDKIARMVGDYSHTKTALYTEKLTGTTSMSLGFIQDKSNFYIPNTILKEDIRDVTLRPQKKILAIYKKNEDELKYYKCSYLAKNVKEKYFPQSIQDMIDEVFD